MLIYDLAKSPFTRSLIVENGYGQDTPSEKTTQMILGRAQNGVQRAETQRTTERDLEADTREGNAENWTDRQRRESRLIAGFDPLLLRYQRLNDSDSYSDEAHESGDRLLAAIPADYGTILEKREKDITRHTRSFATCEKIKYPRKS